MGKNNNQKQSQAQQYPFVSILTPTFNRRPFIQTIIECIRNQTYPKNRMEWVVIDDGTDKIEDLIRQARLEPIEIKYIPVPQKVALGRKRNLSHQHAKGTIMVHMDDDDYYPPERVAHAVETLQKNPNALCVGSSEIYIYFKHIQKMYQFGPYTPTHATAGTFAFRRQLIENNRYNDDAALAEERAFLKDYTVPFAQLDPLKTILVFSHIHNTFDKKTLLDKPDQMVKLSDKTVDQFIRKPEEKQIKDFFMNRIDPLLRDYDPGHPKWKPDVAIQMEQLKKEREEIMQKMQQQNPGIPQIMMNVPGQPPRPLSAQEIMQLLQENQMMVQKLTAENEHLKATFQKQVQEMITLKKRVKELESLPPPLPPVPVPQPVPEPVSVPVPKSAPAPPSLDIPMVFDTPKTKSEPEIRLSQL